LSVSARSQRGGRLYFLVSFFFLVSFLVAFPFFFFLYLGRRRILRPRLRARRREETEKKIITPRRRDRAEVLEKMMMLAEQELRLGLRSSCLLRLDRRAYGEMRSRCPPGKTPIGFPF
jgi:hypothetical protein